MRSAFVLLTIAGLAGCTTTTPQDDPVYLRLTDVEARLQRIERVFDNQSLIELAGQVEELRTETQALRGDVETLRHDTDSAAERQRDLYVDLDQRLQDIEQAQARALAAPATGAAIGAAIGQAGSPPGAALPPGASDKASYDQAYGLIQARRYPEAAAAFQAFLKNYPDSSYVDNAQYWLAETYYVQRQFEAALPQFQKVIDEHPRSGKLPDALLKVGYCNYELKRWDAARMALREVARMFPDTTAARLANERLQVIEKEAR
jgi:tol-pal system protein YbgF